MAEMQTRYRRAVIGIYSDKVALSVEEKNEGGGGFCLYRQQIEEDFLQKDSRADVVKLSESIQQLIELADKLLCDDVCCVGYGLLRYHQGLHQELEHRLGREIRIISGQEQAKAAWKALQHGGEIGMNSGDMSTQLFLNEASFNCQESFPLGWREVWQGAVLIPTRAQEVQLRQKIRALAERSGFPQKSKANRLKVSGMDSVARFMLLLAGETEHIRDELSLERPILGRMMRLMRNPSLRWLDALERSSCIFPQKIYCQMLILDIIMEVLSVSQASLCRVCIEDYLYHEEKVLLKECN